MESTATDAMPDDTDQTSQQPTSETAEVATAQEEANPNPVMELALKDLQARRDTLEAEIAELTSRRRQLDAELKASLPANPMRSLAG